MKTISLPDITGLQQGSAPGTGLYWTPENKLATFAIYIAGEVYRWRDGTIYHSVSLNSAERTAHELRGKIEGEIEICVVDPVTFERVAVAEQKEAA